MKPFILRFSHSPNISEEQKILPSTYNPKFEQMFFNRHENGKHQILMAEATGSLMTKASGDPTQDEPTDR